MGKFVIPFLDVVPDLQDMYVNSIKAATKEETTVVSQEWDQSLTLLDNELKVLLLKFRRVTNYGLVMPEVIIIEWISSLNRHSVVFWLSFCFRASSLEYTTCLCPQPGTHLLLPFLEYALLSEQLSTSCDNWWREGMNFLFFYRPTTSTYRLDVN